MKRGMLSKDLQKQSEFIVEYKVCWYTMQYSLKADMKRGMLSKDLQKQSEFIVEYKVCWYLSILWRLTWREECWVKIYRNSRNSSSSIRFVGIQCSILWRLTWREECWVKICRNSRNSSSSIRFVDRERSSNGRRLFASELIDWKVCQFKYLIYSDLYTLRFQILSV